MPDVSRAVQRRRTRELGNGIVGVLLQCESATIAGPRCEVTPIYWRDGFLMCAMHAASPRLRPFAGIIPVDQPFGGPCPGDGITVPTDEHHLVSGTLCSRCLQHID